MSLLFLFPLVVCLSDLSLWHSVILSMLKRKYVFEDIHLA